MYCIMWQYYCDIVVIVLSDNSYYCSIVAYYLLTNLIMLGY